jgi:lipopolysaccharide transport system ATP-binding protein
MSKPIISVENLGKKYIIGKIIHGRGAPTFRDIFNQKLGNLFRRGEDRKKDDTILWALKGVSFDVKQGEVVGIIGRNGAGKSTLLKVLSRITEPTEGKVTIRGRVASLLEVGTGFSGELTGRENIFLNGSILGMKKAEIKKKFDEIVAFSEIERFIDTPVKRYSSGMYVRLAFAVAAHLDPEILVVDEVLAVGDAQFQKKCLGKMSDVSKEGRTVLFVSHNMATITRLCARSLCLHEGRVIMDDNAPTVVHKYLSTDCGTTAYRKWEDLQRAPGNDTVRLLEMQVNSGNAERSEIVDIRKSVEIKMKYYVKEQDAVVRPFLVFYNEEGVCLFSTTDFDSIWYNRPRPRGIYTSKLEIPGNFLSECNIIINAGLTTGETEVYKWFIEPGVLSFQVVDTLEGDSARKNNTTSYPGVVRPILKWESTQE